jgi:hypothetical protein
MPLPGLMNTGATVSRIPMRGLGVRRNPANHVPQIEFRACADQRYTINLIPLWVHARQEFPVPGSSPARDAPGLCNIISARKRQIRRKGPP